MRKWLSKACGFGRKLGDLVAPVRLREINRRPDRDDPGRINFGVRHVIMTFDVIEINRLGDARSLIQVH